MFRGSPYQWPIQRPIQRLVQLFCLSALAALSMGAVTGEPAPGGSELERQSRYFQQSLDRISRMAARIERINQFYRREIKPVFAKKCFDCHSAKTKYPAYYRMPFVKDLIDGDIADGLEAIDLSTDFPFTGHGMFSTDLPKILLEIESGDMPPYLYRVMHKDSGLTAEERQKVFIWVNRSQVILMDEKTANPALR